MEFPARKIKPHEANTIYQNATAGFEKDGKVTKRPLESGDVGGSIRKDQFWASFPDAPGLQARAGINLSADVSDDPALLNKLFGADGLFFSSTDSREGENGKAVYSFSAGWMDMLRHGIDPATERTQAKGSR